MKATHKTQKWPRAGRKPRFRTAGRRVRGLAALLGLAAAQAGAFTPEAQEVLDILEKRILSAEGGQASRDAFLESVGPEEGCRDWLDAPSWSRDPDLKAAVDAACPSPVPAPRRRVSRASRPPASRPRASRAWSPPGRVGIAQVMRPLEDGPSRPPDLAASLSAPWAGPFPAFSAFGGEATLAGGMQQRRRIWIDRPGLSMQAGSLAFGPEGVPDPFRDGGGRARGRRGIPHLSFMTGKHRFAGSGGRSGLEGAWEARTSALDGLALVTTGPAWQAGGFASWNRFDLGDRDPGRRDALAYSLAAGGASETQGWAVQAARLRLETALEPAGGDSLPESGRPEEIWLAGGAWEKRFPAGTGTDPGRLRAGLAVSRMGGGPAQRDSYPGEAGAYAELEWDGGKPESYSLAIRQATARWANALSSGPALTRDTTAGGLILSGRGEGGVQVRSRLELFQGGAWQAAIVPGGEAAWNLDRGFLAGAGRFTFSLGRGAWEARTARSLEWREAGLPASGPSVHAYALLWKSGPWRAQASLSHREGPGRETLPARLEAAWLGPQGDRWRLELFSEDARDPLAAYRLSCLQAWRLGKGATVRHSLSLPMEKSALGKEAAYRMGLEFSGF